MACQSETSHQPCGNLDDTKSEHGDENNLDRNSSHQQQGVCDTRSYSKDGEAVNALHTLVDMALALEESSVRRAADHTYALMDDWRVKRSTEDRDKVSSEKDHTYASNTIGFRYSNHRSIHAQPRKSASEENLVMKSTQPQTVESSARKCTSAEEFVIPDQSQFVCNDSSDQNFPSVGSNAATLPRSKVRTYLPLYRDICNEEIAQIDNAAITKFRPENCDNESAMEIPVKCDHTYAKFGTKCGSHQLSDQVLTSNVLSSSAPGKLDRVSVDRIAHSGPSDHTYDKLSSAKRKESLGDHTFCKPFVGPSNSTSGFDHTENFRKTELVSEASSCASAMDWQPQDHSQIFEKRFLPMDHTYTTVA